MPDRNLTDDDIEVLASKLREKMMNQFYQDLGQGVLGWFYKLVISAAIALAAYGAGRGFIK